MARAELTRHLRDLWPELDRLIEAGEDVESVRYALGWQHVCALIDAEVEAMQRGLDGDLAYRATHQQLVWAHGRLSGLRAFKDAAEAIIEVAARRRAEQAAKHERAAQAQEA